MPAPLTTDEILRLAPDEAAARAARDLASPARFEGLGSDGEAIWGEVRGSGREPYQATVEIETRAAACSCPSRKQPCKHGLALMLLFAESPGAFAVSDAPERVAEFRAARRRRQERVKAEEARGGEPADPAAQKRRSDARELKVREGMADIEVWLADLVRRGLSSLPAQPISFFAQPAARLVDAQARGASRLVRELPAVLASGEGWPERLLHRLARLHLLARGYRHIDALDPAAQADLRRAIGWEDDQKEAGPPVRGRFLVLGRRVEDDEESLLRIQRTFLRGTIEGGEGGGANVLLLEFSFGREPWKSALPPGAEADLEIGFFASATPLRASLKVQHSVHTELLPGSLPGAATDIASALARYAAALAKNPFLDVWPMALAAVVPLARGKQLLLRDGAGRVLPAHPRFDLRYPLLGMSGGRPIEVFGEFDGDHLYPLSAVAEGRFVSLAEPVARPAESAA